MGLVGLWSVGETKVVRKSVTFGDNSLWQYLTKFGISIGEGTFTVQARFRNALVNSEDFPFATEGRYAFQLHFYLDTKWMNALEEPNCYVKATHEIRLEEILVPVDGRWSDPVIGRLAQRTRPYVWFMAVSDCPGALHRTYPRLPGIEVQVRLTGYDGGEFSHEDIGLLSMYSGLFVFYCVLMGFIVYNFYKDIKKTERIESPLMLLCIAVMLEALAVIVQWLHLFIYSYNGEGLSALHIISVMSEVTSEFVMSLLLMLLSWGWTVTYLDFYKTEGYVLLIVLLLMFHMIVAGLTELTNDAYHKYHDYEGVQGVLLVGARVAMLIYFLCGIYSTRRLSKAKAVPFLRVLTITGCVHLFAFPALVISCFFTAHYVRHKVITIGTIVVQTATMCFLLRLFSGNTIPLALFLALFAVITSSALFTLASLCDLYWDY